MHNAVANYESTSVSSNESEDRFDSLMQNLTHASGVWKKQFVTPGGCKLLNLTVFYLRTLYFI